MNPTSLIDDLDQLTQQYSVSPVHLHNPCCFFTIKTHHICIHKFARPMCISDKLSNIHQMNAVRTVTYFLITSIITDSNAANMFLLTSSSFHDGGSSTCYTDVPLPLEYTISDWYACQGPQHVAFMVKVDHPCRNCTLIGQHPGIGCKLDMFWCILEMALLVSHI